MLKNYFKGRSKQIFRGKQDHSLHTMEPQKILIPGVGSGVLLDTRTHIQSTRYFFGLGYLPNQYGMVMGGFMNKNQLN